MIPFLNDSCSSPTPWKSYSATNSPPSFAKDDEIGYDGCGLSKSSRDDQRDECRPSTTAEIYTLVHRCSLARQSNYAQTFVVALGEARRSESVRRADVVRPLHAGVERPLQAAIVATHAVHVVERRTSGSPSTAAGARRFWKFRP